MKKTVKVEVREVSWTDDKVNKYQAIASYMEGVKVIKRILGDPQTDKFKAVKSLAQEAHIWYETAMEVVDYLELEYNQ